MKGIYKVTRACVDITNGGYEVFKIQLDNHLKVTKLFPFQKKRKEKGRNNDKLYDWYLGDLDFKLLIGNYIYASLGETKYGYEFDWIASFDVVNDFKNKLESYKGKTFSTRFPIHDLLSKLQRTIELDNSIKIKSSYGDVRVYDFGEFNLCCQYDNSVDTLNVFNINLIFEHFYKNTRLPAYCQSEGGENSYYSISIEYLGIVRMDNHVRISGKMTKSGDFDTWDANLVLGFGAALTEEQKEFLKKNSVV